MRVVDQTMPLNDHKLNRNLYARWQVLEQDFYGHGRSTTRYRDLTRRHDATQTAGSVFEGAVGSRSYRKRPGGFGSRYFDGNLHQMNAGSAWMPSGDLTIALWFNTTNSGTFQSLFSAYTADSNAMEIFIDTGGANQLFGGNYDDRALTGTNSVFANTWYRVVLTSINGGPTQFYLNGVAVGTTGLTNFATRSVQVDIGCRSNTFPFGGWMDDIRVYNTRWTATTIAVDYAETKGGYQDSLNWIEPVVGVAGAPLGTQSAAPRLPRVAWMPHLRM